MTKYLTETKVCTPDRHELGIVDGDKRIVLCRFCNMAIAKWEQAFINTGQVKPERSIK